MLYTDIISSPIGNLHLVSNGSVLTHLWLEGQKYVAKIVNDDKREHGQPVLETQKPIWENQLPIFAQAREWLQRYFAGENPGVLPPLSPQGTDFQQAVWRLLQQIPYGTTTTYSALARQLARQRGMKTISAQAVGGAIGRNPLCIFIPCHRVVGANGSLTGYVGGIERKRQLLEIEHIDLSPFFVPKDSTSPSTT